MEEKEIYVLVCGEEKIQKEDLGMNMQDDVGFFVTVVAYVDVETNEFKKENQKLCWSKDKNEFSGKFKDKKIYKVKVEVNPYSKEMDLKEILEEDCHEKRLEDVVYHFKDKVEWKFKGQIYLLNRTQDAFVSVQAINDDDCIIQLKVDEEYGDTAYKSLKTWEKMEQDYQMTFHKGSGAQADKSAKEFVEKYGFDALKKTAKLHFKNTEKIK